MSVAAIAGLNSIKHKNALPREAVSVPTVIKKEIKTEPVVKKESSKKTGGIQDAFNKVTKKSSPEKAQQSKSSGPSTTGTKGTTGATKGKGGSGIAGMFARQTNKPPKPKSTEEKENIANQKIEADTSSGSKDSSPEVVKSNAKTSGSKKAKSSGKKPVKGDDGKKRKRIQVMSESDSEEDKPEEMEKTAAEVEEEAPPVSKLIESDEEAEEIAATPVQESKTRVGRRRVKKLVDKTYMDDAGYDWSC